MIFESILEYTNYILLHTDNVNNYILKFHLKAIKGHHLLGIIILDKS